MLCSLQLYIYIYSFDMLSLDNQGIWLYFDDKSTIKGLHNSPFWDTLGCNTKNKQSKSILTNQFVKRFPGIFKLVVPRNTTMALKIYLCNN